MKLHKHIKYIVGIFLLGATSCSFTDINPKDFVGDNNAFESVDQFRQHLIGGYKDMSLKTSMHISSIVVDDVSLGGQAGGFGSDNYNWTYVAASGDQNAEWSKNYRVINHVNRMIQGVVNVPINSDEDKKNVDDYMGQAYFIRAYSHFDLLRFFADFSTPSSLGIPYILEPHLEDQPERNKVEECFTLLHKDLDKAMELIVEESSTNPAFASKLAVKALRARILFYEQKYAEAQSLATEVLNAQPIVNLARYSHIWADQTNDGVIFKLSRNPGEEAIGTMYYGIDNSSLFTPSKSFMNVIDSVNDIRYELWFTRAEDRDGAIVDVVNKYPGTDSNRGLNDQKVLRSAEMLLIVAECQAKTSDLSGASATINTLRKERLINYTEVNFQSKEEALTEILLERRKELAYEGHRYFDLRRHRLPIVRTENLYLPADDHHQIQPIPEAEFNANINMVQNPGYAGKQ
ncbi:RagB/SusD family nutrient uptake outer membrane protein [Flammeovirga pacifica]|nr:RagB/SusD family nutrient uptake outer membrane protein [Flammeovirga pacifica]